VGFFGEAHRHETPFSVNEIRQRLCRERLRIFKRGGKEIAESFGSEKLCPLTKEIMPLINLGLEDSWVRKYRTSV